MSSQVSLKDIYEAVNRLEDKMDGRLKTAEAKIDALESIANKAVVIFSLVNIFLTAGFSWVWNKVTKG